MNSVAILRTARLTLRPFELADAEFVCALLNSPGWLRYIGDRGVRRPADAERYLRAGPLASYRQHGFGLLHVSHTADGAPVGMCGLLRREGFEEVEIGFALLPEWTGRGLAREAANAVIAEASERLRLARLFALVQADNEASRRLLEHLHFARERTLRLSPNGPELHVLARTL